MFNFKYEFNNNIPHFGSNFCGKCSGIEEATSFTSLEKRGCCWYFPKYDLVDIKNILGIGRRDFLNEIKDMEKSKIGKYIIEIFGVFNKEAYNDFKRNESFSSNFNEELYFKLCPFITPAGCRLDSSLRSHPCNFYICKSIIKWCGDAYRPFNEERKDYFSYSSYFHETIKEAMIENSLDLESNFDKSLDFINSYELPPFEPRTIPEIFFDTTGKK